MFKNEEYSSFLNIFTKIKLAILSIYKFYIPISTFRVSYKATTQLLLPPPTKVIVILMEISISCGNAGLKWKTGFRPVLYVAFPLNLICRIYNYNIKG